MNLSTTHKYLTRALVLALIAAAPLAAQENIRFGGQLSLVNSTGDDADYASTGFGAGLLGEMAIDKNFAIRARLEC